MSADFLNPSTASSRSGRSPLDYMKPEGMQRWIDRIRGQAGGKADASLR